MGKDVWFEELRSQYDSVCISIGAHTDKKTGIPGEESEGVVSAVEMLRAIGDSEMPDFTGKRVVVIGGGQPIVDGVELAEYRGDALWNMDAHEKVRFSHENEEIRTLYREYLEKPCGERSHHLLHTDHGAWQMPLAPARKK